ncbi:beta-N-acetylhexosaminidase [Saccharococcus caldoxylosilyticus]|uniref:beta-N-acetylhexosaminidase n=1 Tax=Saccharococcus caldoxylosilyticus TaxID=81408 RepID=UPI001FCC3CB9|nr:beta-N-acetylhexosaminidase [Parageobacillus caldoxylosilyticus]BDG35425.1 beta-hexosaminidase [Parageobacillus caldoxylosilyticus]BDG39203.1 beta-hexosaminidase [Parageobacillus caldoxylosilyticus]BDG42987.1 beta-hexosaminidase [Parageobacillus caldoxylosilyticus]
MLSFYKKITAILVTAMMIFVPWTSPQAHTEKAKTGLIIYQNIPEVDVKVNGNKILLRALHVHREGYFTEVTEGLRWKSSNKKVATVDDHGVVTFFGKSGKTFITVTDGMRKDCIAFAVKTAPASKKSGKQNVKVTVVKEKGSRYDIIQKAIDGLTLEEKIGQMLMPDFRNFNGKPVTAMLPEIKELIQKYHIGGVILFRENVVTTEQTAKLVADYQQAAEKFGLLMSIDQEGGIVTRLQSGTNMPGNMALGATRSKELAYKVGHAIGEELYALGINMNLAPVLDVNNNPDNPVIGVRSFGENPELVAELGVSYIKGLQDSGIAATAKHFPGHGDTAVDSHLGLPEVPHDRDRLQKVELYPFQKAMEAGVDAIMTAHVTFPKIDDTKVISQKDGTEISLPATLSYKVLTELMRKEMGFDGVIITDAMNMQAISDHFGPVDAAVRAVQAGADIVLMPVGLEEVASGLKKAVQNGDISQERINASVKRILTLKVKRGIFKQETPPDTQEIVNQALRVVGSKEHKQIEAEAAAKSITLVKNDHVLPLQKSKVNNLVVVGNTMIESLGEAVRTYVPNATVIQAAAPLDEAQLQKVKEADAVIVGTYTSNVSGRLPSSPQMKMVQQIIANTDAPVIVIGIRNPYDVMSYPNVDAYLAQYGFQQASFQAAADTIFGVNTPTGKLPVTIPSYDGGVLYEYGHGLTY